MSDNIKIEEKDRRVIKQILGLESVNNRVQRYTNQEMIQKIAEIINKGAHDEI